MPRGSNTNPFCRTLKLVEHYHLFMIGTRHMTVFFFTYFLRSWLRFATLSISVALTACGGGSSAAMVESVPFASKILFVGNSFTRGDGALDVVNYKPSTVTDLNGNKLGGVPAIFKAFTLQSGLNYVVSFEVVSGASLKHHYQVQAPLLQRAWDVVLMQDYSTLNKDDPGNANELIAYSDHLAAMFIEKNPSVVIKIAATWSRADQTYLPNGHWYGHPIETMALDLMKAYQTADQKSIAINGVVPIGMAWNRAFTSGFADANPYDGIDNGRVNLWATDNYHASKFGSYLEALTIFGSVTGRDPRTLGAKETVAADLGITQQQAQQMQQIAYEQLH